jgi:beta-lactamase regulating signal transducer with metallopeptidase domain
MNGVLSRFVLLQAYYPNICLFVVSALKSSAIVLLGWGAVSLLKSRSARARCWIWRFVLLAGLALLALDFGPTTVRKMRLTMPVQPNQEQAQTFWHEAASLNIVRSGNDLENFRTEKESRDLQVQAPPWQRLRPDRMDIADFRTAPWSWAESRLLKVWWIVAAAFMAVTAIRVAAGLLWLRKCAVGSEQIRKICEQAAQEMAIRSHPNVRMADAIKVPLISGIVRPAIYLPETVTLWNEEKLRAVFFHELAHWKRWDHLWRYLGIFVGRCFWWNPLIGLAARRMGAAAEEAADDIVLAGKTAAYDYARLLVEVAAQTKGRPLPVGVPMVGYRLLKNRIDALLINNPWRDRIGPRAAVTMVAVIALCFAATSLYVVHAAGLANAGLAKEKLTPNQRSILERIRQANAKRLTELRFLHLKMETTTTIEADGKVKTSPHPSKMEAWVDGWTGIRRAEFRPRVSPWTDGAAPFYIEDALEINDGSHSYFFDSQRDPSEIHGGPPGSDEPYLGLHDTSDLVRMIDGALELNSLGATGYYDVLDTDDSTGKTLTRFREEISSGGKVIQTRTFLIDPDQDEMLVSAAMAKSGWVVKETGLTNTGVRYPMVLERKSGSRNYPAGNGKAPGRSEAWTTTDKVVALEILSTLPPGITDLPKSQKEQFVAAKGRQIRHESLNITYTNVTNGAPIGGIVAKVDFNNGGAQVITAKSNGALFIPTPTKEVTSLSIYSTAKGFSPQVTSWRKAGDAIQLPEKYEIKLSPSAPISGRVVNEQGQPIPNADIHLHVYRGTSSWSVFSDRISAGGSLKSSANGSWAYQDAPADLNGLSIRVSAPGYRATTDSGGGDFRTFTGQSYESLHDGTCTITLNRGVQLVGRVHDPSGKPVAKCSLTMGRDRWGTNLPVTETDSEGNFNLSGLAEGKAWLTAESAEYKPYAVELTLPAAGPLDVVLQSGNVLRGRLVREDGQPCAQFHVEADTWQDLRTLRFKVDTDADGKFVWKGAPDETVKMVFGGCGNPQTLFMPVTAKQEEQTIVMKPALRLSGHAVDASTGQTVRDVKVTPGRLFDRGNIYWNRQEATTHHDGQFSFKTDQVGEKRVFRLEADGYQSLETKPIEANQSDINETFRLMAKNN